QRSDFVALRRQYAADRGRGSLCRPHSCRGKAAAALCRFPEDWFRGGRRCREAGHRMSDAQFDEIEAGYEGIVEQSISFSGLRHDFFMAVKADLLFKITRRHFANPDALDLL